jgi:UDP-N-acetylglucosamine--N-acetylmuramyl-(pentapeptide) pyrophosphoryl-undecaprenol N-acetylglucosamine transferase
MTRILFVGGGSVGHLAPSVAVWRAVQKKDDAAQALFVCSPRRDDREFLETQKVRRASIHAPKPGSLARMMLFVPLLIISSCESLMILLIFRPRVIFAKGGYVSVPICLMGWLLRRPIVLHESDRIMGRANQLLLKYATHLCIGTPQKELANTDIMARLDMQITATGNPIREDLLKGSKDGGRRVTGFSGKKPVLLITGGSQGAHALNEVVCEKLEELVSLCDVLHITGRGKLNPRKHHARYWQREVIFEELGNIYALADIVLSRAGASAISELAALGKTVILVPLPDEVQKHQGENAHFLKVANAAIVLSQETLRDTLVPTVRSLMQDEAQRKTLGVRLKAFAEPNAAERIANILMETAKS